MESRQHNSKMQNANMVNEQPAYRKKEMATCDTYSERSSVFTFQ